MMYIYTEDIYTQAAVTYLSRKPFIGTGTSLPRLQKPWMEENAAGYELSLMLVMVLMHCV